jgi:hypothetical protein
MVGFASESVGNKAKRLLLGGIAGDALVGESGVAGKPIPICSPNRKTVGWFVPVIVADVLAGFMQFDVRCVLRRYSSFQRRPGSVEGCPLTKLWIDREAIRAVAAERLGKGYRPLAPYLTYDRSPDRLVWAVPARHNVKGTRTVFVAGGYAYVAATLGVRPLDCRGAPRRDGRRRGQEEP